MAYFWENDDLLDQAKSLLAESPDDLKARLVAQAMRLQVEAANHLEAMTVQDGYPPAIIRIANLLAKHPYMVESVMQLIETKLREMIGFLPVEAETNAN